MRGARLLETWPERTMGETAAPRFLAGIASIGAGILHLAAAPAHFEERSDIGFFFLMAGVDQIAAGVLIILFPSLAVIGVTLLGTLAVIGIYFASRTTGLPLGTAPGTPEPVAPLDLAVVTLEMAQILLLSYVLGLSAAGRRRAGSEEVIEREPDRASGSARRRLADSANGRGIELIAADAVSARAEARLGRGDPVTMEGGGAATLLALALAASDALAGRRAAPSGSRDASRETVQLDARLITRPRGRTFTAEAQVARADRSAVVIETTILDEGEAAIGSVSVVYEGGAAPEDGAVWRPGNGRPERERGGEQ